jgi:hypothetical protein
MTTQPSRPKRWRTAVERANNAATALAGLREEWKLKLQELHEEVACLRKKNAIKCGELKDELQKLMNLQNEYQDWSSRIPDQLSDSATKEKLDAVEDIYFERLLKNGLDQKIFVFEEALDEAVAAIEVDDYNEEDPLEDVFTTLENALECDLPLGFGRDQYRR